MKKHFRWPAWAVLLILVLTVLGSATAAILHTIPFSAVHAAANTTGPTLSMPDVVHAYDNISVTGQGFAAGDQVSLSLLETNSSYFLGAIPCDSNGNCSGMVAIPAQYIPQGMYQVVGTGRTGLSAQVSVTVLPGFIIYVQSNTAYGQLSSAGPGTPVVLDMEAFNPNEKISIYWDKTLEGTTTTQSNGSDFFDFTVPATATAGSYSIVIERSNQTPSELVKPFTVLAPKVISSAGVRINQPVHVKLSGFLSGENVAISWNANGGQTITTLTVDSTGALDTYFAPPPAAKGAYTLMATGKKSGLQASSSLHIGPGILLDLNTANPGGTTTVEGGGYTPGETVDVYFQTQSNGVTGTVVDSSGSFTLQISIPVTHKKSTLYYVYAVSTSSNDAAKAQFFYGTPSIQVSCYCYYGSSYTVSGQEFTAQETVSIYRQYSGEKGTVLAGTTTAASDGSFTFTSTMTSAPYTTGGYPTPSNMKFIAVGSLSKVSVYGITYVRANIIPTPGAGQIGQKINLSGGGFGAGETVTLSFQNYPLGTATAGPNGGFHTTFIVPKGSVPGNHFNNLLAIGNTTNASANVPFGVLPSIHISPKTGPSGTAITVWGNGYSPSLLYIDWYDPATNTKTQLTQLNVNSGGIFSTTITAPSNLISGNTYYVVVVNFSVGTSLQAPFVAQ